MAFFGGSNPVGTTSPYVSSVNGTSGAVVLDVPTDAEVAALASTAAQATFDAQTALGALGPAVSQVASDAINANNPVVNQLANKTGYLDPLKVGPFTVDGTTFTTLTALVAYLNAKFSSQGATAPVISTAPNFSDTTPDEGQQITITPGTYTGTQPTSKSWHIDIENNGSLSFDTSTILFTVPVGAGQGATRSIKIVELAVWSGGVVTNTSITRTVNASAAIPVNTTRPGLSGTAQVGQTLTGSVGSWTNTPTSYIKQFYRNGVAISGATATSNVTTLAYVVTSADAGASITFGVIGTNAASGVGGTGVVQAFSTASVIAGGVAPSWTAPGAIQPGWVNGTFQVGVAMVADFGAAANNPAVNGYSYQVLRDGVAIAGATGSNVSSMSYTPVSADQDHEVSFTLTASNGAGSATTTAASVTIAAATSGGGGAPVLVGISKLGSAAAASGLLPVVSGAQSGDFAVIIQTNNGPVNWNAPTGGGTWNLSGAEVTLTINGEKAGVWTKAIGSSEPANYTIAPASAEIFGAILLVFRGPTSVIAQSSNSSNLANASPLTTAFSTVTTTAVNQLHLLIQVLDQSAGAIVTETTPSGYSVVAQMDFTGSGTDWASIVAMTKTVTAAGATGTINATATLSAGTAGWIAFSEVLG